MDNTVAHATHRGKTSDIGNFEIAPGIIAGWNSPFAVVFESKGECL